MSQNDSGADVAQRCRDLLFAGVAASPNPGLGLARHQGEVVGIGWHHVNPEQVGGRTGDVLLEGVLADAILRLNPALQATPDRAHAVVGEVRRIVGIARNAGIGAARGELVPWILGQRALPGRIYVRLVDLGDVDQNSFVVTEHQPVEVGGAAGEPAFVLYVNGIPVVLLDTETPVPGQEADADVEEVEPAAPAAAVPGAVVPGAAVPGEVPAATEAAVEDAGDAGGDAGDSEVGEAAGDSEAAGEAVPEAAGEAEAADEAAGGEPPEAAGETEVAGATDAAGDAAGEPEAAGEPAAAAEPEAAAETAGAADAAAPAEAPAPPVPKAPRAGTWQLAATRLVALQEQLPELFVANLMTAATDGNEFHHATTGVAVGEWQHWDPGAGATGGDRAGVAVKTVLRPDALLDLLASFAFGWEDE